MRRIFFSLLLLCLATASFASTVDYTVPGTYTVPANCGFVSLGPTDGYIRMSLTNDAGRTSDLWVLGSGEEYPLSLKSVTIYPGSAGIRVNTTPRCFCSSSNLTHRPGEGCYTRSLTADECEVDESRPEQVDGPGNDLSLVSTAAYNGTGFSGDIDILSFNQTDHGDYWQTLRLHPGERAAVFGGVRRCRLVSGSNVSSLTTVAP